MANTKGAVLTLCERSFYLLIVSFFRVTSAGQLGWR